MAEAEFKGQRVRITRDQLDAIARFVEGHPTGISIEEGPFNASYVTVKLLDAENAVVKKAILTWAGVPPRADALPPDWPQD